MESALVEKALLEAVEQRPVARIARAARSP